MLPNRRGLEHRAVALFSVPPRCPPRTPAFPPARTPAFPPARTPAFPPARTPAFPPAPVLVPACVALAACLMSGGPAFAGGLSLPVRGVRALSMGGAFVAGAEGVNALWYNPSQIDSNSVGLEVAMVSLSASFTASQGDQAGQTVANGAAPIPNPTVGITWRANDTLSLGAGIYAPYAGFSRFDPNGPQRYSLVESDRTTLLYMHVGAALHFGNFRVGAGLQNVDVHINQRMTLSGYTGLFGTPSDPSLDVLDQVVLTKHFNLTGNAGAAYDLGPLTFGVGVQLPYTVSGDANFSVRLPSSPFFDSTSVQGNTVHISVPFPLMVRGGVAWRILPRWMAEFAVNWENWSVQKQIVLDPRGQVLLRGLPGIGDYLARPMVLDRRMHNTTSLHLGTDVAVASGLHLRGGAFWEPSAFGDETFSVAQLDDNKIGVASGVLWEIGAFDLEGAFSWVFQGTRVVNNSQLRQLDPTNPSETDVVGNGTYRTSYWIAGIGGAWHFGGPDAG